MFDAGPHYDEPDRYQAERRALFHDRLKALGAFTGIAIGAVAGIEMVIGGGFDFINIGPEVREVAPSHYVSVYRAPWSNEAQVVSLSSTEPLFAGDFIQVDGGSDRLAGSYDDSRTPDAVYTDVSESAVRDDIARLYANSGTSYTEASITYEAAPAIDDTDKSDPYADAEAMVEEALGDFGDEPGPLHPS